MIWAGNDDDSVHQTILPRNAAAVKAVFFIAAITGYRVRFCALMELNEGAGGTYMLEKTFMMMPPEIISTMARIAGRSGFCL